MSATAFVSLQDRTRAAAMSISLPFTWILLALMASYFTFFYAEVIYQLPLFGDATEHARIARELLRGHVFSSSSPYPPLYHSLGALGLAIAGEDGFKTITVLSIAFLGPAVFLLARELSDSGAVGLVAALIAYVSPKTPFYAGRLYMELFLVVLVVLAFYFLLRYLKSEKKLDLACFAVLAALTAITKQQGLVLVALPGFAYLFGRELVEWLSQRSRPRFLSLRIYLPMLLVFLIPALLWQMKTSASLLPETEFTSWINHGAREMTGVSAIQAEWRQRWDFYLTERFVTDGHQAKGFAVAESNHIWPHEVFTSPAAFFGINSPYWRVLGNLKSEFPLLETTVLCALFAGGLVFFFANTRNPAWIPLMGFLLLNYTTFLKNTDQLRYHLFIPYILAFLIPFCVYNLVGLVGKSQLARTLTLSCFAVLVLAYSSQYLQTLNNANLRNWDRQSYTLSVGGMHSVIEASDFVHTALGIDQTFFAVPATEFAYYADRQVLFDHRLYFLDAQNLNEIFRDMGVSLIVIPKSLIVQDADWNHVGRAPASFVAKIESLYPKVFETQLGDIDVYEVRR